jgi:hypothetical protein
MGPVPDPLFIGASLLFVSDSRSCLSFPRRARCFGRFGQRCRKLRSQVSPRNEKRFPVRRSARDTPNSHHSLKTRLVAGTANVATAIPRRKQTAGLTIPGLMRNGSRRKGAPHLFGLAASPPRWQTREQRPSPACLRRCKAKTSCRNENASFSRTREKRTGVGRFDLQGFS